MKLPKIDLFSLKYYYRIMVVIDNHSAVIPPELQVKVDDVIKALREVADSRRTDADGLELVNGASDLKSDALELRLSASVLDRTAGRLEETISRGNEEMENVHDEAVAKRGEGNTERKGR